MDNMATSNVASASTPPIGTVGLPSSSSPSTYNLTSSSTISHTVQSDSKPSLNSNISYPSSINLSLPQFQQRNTSVSSLFEAVMGSNQGHNHHQQNQSPQQSTSPAHYLPTPIALKPQSNPLTGNPNNRSGLGHGSGSTGISKGDGLDDWDILNDVTGRINENTGTGVGAGVGHGKPQNDQAVKELQEKVDKRRSQLPHLEEQLAALEAQIKATEERLNKASGGAGTAQ